MGVWSSNASVGNIIARFLNFTNLKVPTTVKKRIFENLKRCLYCKWLSCLWLPVRLSCYFFYHAPVFGNLILYNYWSPQRSRHSRLKWAFSGRKYDKFLLKSKSPKIKNGDFGCSARSWNLRSIFYIRVYRVVDLLVLKSLNNFCHFWTKVWVSLFSFISSPWIFKCLISNFHKYRTKISLLKMMVWMKINPMVLRIRLSRPRPIKTMKKS